MEVNDLHFDILLQGGQYDLHFDILQYQVGYYFMNISTRKNSENDTPLDSNCQNGGHFDLHFLHLGDLQYDLHFFQPGF